MATRPWTVGALRERITIQQNTTTADTQGGRSSSWGTLATVWAAVLPPPKGSEQFQAQATGSALAHTLRIRHLATVTPLMRVLWTPSYSSTTAQKTLEIHAVRPDPFAPTRYLLLDCGERR